MSAVVGKTGLTDVPSACGWQQGSSPREGGAMPLILTKVLMLRARRVSGGWAGRHWSRFW